MLLNAQEFTFLWFYLLHQIKRFIFYEWESLLSDTGSSQRFLLAHNGYRTNPDHLLWLFTFAAVIKLIAKSFTLLDDVDNGSKKIESHQQSDSIRSFFFACATLKLKKKRSNSFSFLSKELCFVLLVKCYNEDSTIFDCMEYKG